MLHRPADGRPTGTDDADRADAGDTSAGGGHRKFVFLAAATRYAMDLPDDDVTDEAPTESADGGAGECTEPGTSGDDVIEAMPDVGDQRLEDRSPGATRRGGHSRHRRRPRRAHALGAVHITLDDDEDSPVIASPVSSFSAQPRRSSATPRTGPGGASPGARRLALVALLVVLGVVAAVAQAARHPGTSGEPAAASSNDSGESISTTVSTFVVLPQVPERLTTTTVLAPTTATLAPVTTTQPTTMPTTRFVTSTTTRPLDTATTEDPVPTTVTQPVTTTTLPPPTTTTQAPTTTTTAATTTTMAPTTTTTAAP